MSTENFLVRAMMGYLNMALFAIVTVFVILGIFGQEINDFFSIASPEDAKRIVMSTKILFILFFSLVGYHILRESMSVFKNQVIPTVVRKNTNMEYIYNRKGIWYRDFFSFILNWFVALYICISCVFFINGHSVDLAFKQLGIGWDIPIRKFLFIVFTSLLLLFILFTLVAPFIAKLFDKSIVCNNSNFIQPASIEAVWGSIDSTISENKSKEIKTTLEERTNFYKDLKISSSNITVKDNYIELSSSKLYDKLLEELNSDFAKSSFSSLDDYIKDISRPLIGLLDTGISIYKDDLSFNICLDTNNHRLLVDNCYRVHEFDNTIEFSIKSRFPKFSEFYIESFGLDTYITNFTIDIKVKQ